MVVGAKSRAASARAVRDTVLVEAISAIHAENFSVYGGKKMHAAMRRAGHHVGREQTRRLMRLAGVRGAQRAAKVFTTRPDPIAARPTDTGSAAVS